ncbi:uncharacterized protein EI97DRAFT_383421 [Westerdykella ornata]|uniref:C2H2-type domain-containing protein n=1 Tax=Westerdykella ornata TaxID=318751 RepID=A0A6A6JBD6_WESOR|nr:uncharacterized protein EI97DRAFT_383421 [Westerdykella ornata]KAF2273605.1 hypothetical protein EI97DRAFT_383421 [Westerdykella ornata]
MTSQYADSGAWQEVKRGPQGKKALKTIVIRAEKPKDSPQQATGHARQPTSELRETIWPLTLPSAGNSDIKSFNPLEHWCGVCSIKLPNKIALQTHAKQLPGHENYCNLCKRVFKDRNGLKNHVDNSAGHEVFCNLCLSAFKDKWGLRNHFENNLSVGHHFACLECLRGFQTVEKLKLHLHTAARHVRCETCHRNFRNQDERNEHWVTTKKHKHCLQPGCDFDAASATLLEKHIQQAHFQCDQCLKVFPSGSKLSAHVGTCAPLLHCKDCNEYFPTQESFTVHREACFWCPSCGHWTEREEVHMKHLSTHGIAYCKCWLCSKPMRSQSQLISHLEKAKCPQFTDPTHLPRMLGTWWYSVLYMDIDLHTSLRTGRCATNELAEWLKADIVPLFVCRAEGCGETFGRFSALVYHVETGDCEWTAKRLRFDMLEKELARYMAENGLHRG